MASKIRPSRHAILIGMHGGSRPFTLLCASHRPHSMAFATARVRAHVPTHAICTGEGSLRPPSPVQIHTVISTIVAGVHETNTRKSAWRNCPPIAHGPAALPGSQCHIVAPARTPLSRKRACDPAPYWLGHLAAPGPWTASDAPLPSSAPVPHPRGWTGPTATGLYLPSDSAP